MNEEPLKSDVESSDAVTADAPAAEAALPGDEEAVAEADSSDVAVDEASTAEDSTVEEPTAVEESEVDAPAEEQADASPPPADDADEDELIGKKDWYILKVQSNRENTISAALERRVKVAGLDEYFEEIIVPIEKRTEVKGGRKRIVKQKLYPGYIVVHMEINDDTWFLVRETPGIGDFTGSAGKPTPMLPHEVDRIIVKPDDEQAEQPSLKINFSIEDKVKITDGSFENFEGEVSSIDQATGRVQVLIQVFGRPTPVELEYWQIESL